MSLEIGSYGKGKSIETSALVGRVLSQDDTYRNTVTKTRYFIQSALQVRVKWDE